MRCHFCLILSCSITGKAPKGKLISSLIGAGPWTVTSGPTQRYWGRRGAAEPTLSLIRDLCLPWKKEHPQCLLSPVSCLKWHAGEKKMRIHNRSQVGSYLREFHKTSEAFHAASACLAPHLGAAGRWGWVSHFFTCPWWSSFAGKPLNGHISTTSISPMYPETAPPARVPTRSPGDPAGSCWPTFSVYPLSCTRVNRR